MRPLTAAVSAAVSSVVLGASLVATPATTSAGASAPATGTEVAAEVAEPKVLAISLDGFNPTALRKLGRELTPNLHRLFREGAGTRNARTQVEQTVTLPNHTSMVTGRRIAAGAGGHGVTWNEEIPDTTVQEAAGEDVASVFTGVHDAGGTTGLFSTKEKFRLFTRSWPDAVDRTTVKVEQDGAVVRAARRDLAGTQRTFTFLHLGLADETGHDQGWMSAAYLKAIERLDHLVGTLMTTIESTPGLESTVLVLTADHGGVPGTRSHSNEKRLANYRVPFVIWGAGVDHGDLYAMNPGTRADPGDTRVRFDGTQPVRNGEVANLALDLLGLPAVTDSRWNADQSLTWQD